jgi:hypothetical protein
MKSPRKQIGYYFNTKENLLTSLLQKNGKLCLLVESVLESRQVLDINLHIPFSLEHNYFIYQKSASKEEEKSEDEKRYERFSKIYQVYSANSQSKSTGSKSSKFLSTLTEDLRFVVVRDDGLIWNICHSTASFSIHRNQAIVNKFSKFKVNMV